MPFVIGHPNTCHRGQRDRGRIAQKTQDAQYSVRCLQAGDRPGVRYSALGGDAPRDASTQTEDLTIAMRLPLTASRSHAASHDLLELPASPNPIEPSREPPVAIRARIQAPVRRRQAMRDLSLEIVRQGSAGPSGEEAGDLSIDVSLPGFHEGIENAP